MKPYTELREFAFNDQSTASFRDQLREARATGSVVNPGNGAPGPMIVRHAAAMDLLRDKRVGGLGMALPRLSGIPEGSRTWRWLEKFLLFMEGDDHHRVRLLVGKAFTPRAVETLRPYARSVIRALVDAVFDHGRCDAVAKLSDPFPIPVICALIGVEPDRVDDMSRWARALTLAVRFDAGQYLAEIEQGWDELEAYVREQIADRRKAPRDDLLSRLITAEESGHRLSTEELQALVAILLAAGTDTTRNQLANMIQTFTEFPNEWALLRSRPDLVSNAVEESIRWQPAFHGTSRIAMEDIVLDGVLIPAGSIVAVMSLSTNHDEAALVGAERFDIARKASGSWQLLTFGSGIHYCLGASLARLELTEALAELSSRFVELRLDGEATPTPFGAPVKGYIRLPIAWT
jgi:cytochrome P450